MADKKQQLVLSIIDFLNQSIDDGTVKQDDREGLEVAIQCIGEAFGVDPSDDKQRDRLSIKPAKLQTIFDVFLKTRDKVVSSPAPTPSAPSADTKAKAEKLKQTGNTHMTVKKYDEAIDAYTKAIALDTINPVYYSNRAAAYASKGDHASAILDSEKAIEVDPKFVKAYSRLGHAQYTLGDYKAAAAAFKKGVELDPTNANLKSGLQNAMDRIPSEDDDDEGPPPLVPEGDNPLSNTGAGAGAGAGGLGGMADMFRNMGGMGGAGGGMPDLASLMNNPMMMQMAQQMMANGGMERLMSNPNVANMMNRMQSGGGTPSMEELMADPELRNM
ncbi:TPR-like protein [Suillus clintonianus]|uniref:TPR-like protein n=1 Tax=Suillus clintonianus TaxID=1904413 RepID=UPI001B886321|nr:TPR-like protein [Suillus clintonianus]KAG2155484.1 TPR-like protein [Suillus clintonianus]